MNGEEDEVQSGASAEALEARPHPVQPVTVDIEADPTLGYASIQNSVPVIRALRVTNNGADALEHIEVSVSCNPRFAESMTLRFERLAAGESRRISPLDLRPDHSYLAELQEAAAASISVTVHAAGTELGRETQAVQVLAYDQWAGTRALPELLAAFCMPNNPAVDVLVGKASALLRNAHNELSMNGYQSKSRDVVWKQTSAIYSTLAPAGGLLGLPHRLGRRRPSSTWPLSSWHRVRRACLSLRCNCSRPRPFAAAHPRGARMAHPSHLVDGLVDGP